MEDVVRVAHLEQRLDVRGVAVVAEQVARIVGVGTDDGDRRRRGRVDRQRSVVAQQHDALAGERTRELTTRRGADDRRGLGDVHEGALEQAELELGPQHPLDGAIDDLDGDDSCVDGVDQRRPVAVGHRELDIEPRRQRHRCGLGGVGHEVVVVLELAHREVVGDDVAVEAPLVAEDPGQQLV